MTNEQHNWLDMFSRVIKHATDNQAITDTIPAFANGILALAAKKAAIVLKAGAQQEEITGVTKDKAAARKDLDEITFATISPVVAYALSIEDQDNELHDKMKHPISFIEKVQDDEIVAWATARLTIINDIVSINPNPLVGYGITPASITTWQAAIKAYDPQSAAPQTAKSHRKSLTEELNELFTEGNDIVDNTLEPISIGFKKDNPHYYKDFQNATIIIDLGKGTTILNALVQSDVGGELKPVWKATVSVDLRDDESAITDIDGKAVIKPVKRGEVTATVSHPDFISQTTDPLEIIQGKTVSLEFVLVQTS